MAYEDQQPQETPVRRPIETASGTTSADNARSGNLAYVIALIAIVACLAMGFVMRGCTRLMVEVLEDEHRRSDHSEYEQFIENYLNDELDHDDRVYTDGENNRPDTPSTQGGTLEVKDVLGSSLAIYDDTIDSLLAASDYANAQRGVSDAVRAMVLVDRDASSELTSTLRNAAWGDGALADTLKDAEGRAREVAEELRAMELPEVTGERANDVAGSLKAGRDKAAERWDAIAAELDLLAKGDTVSSSEVSEADRLVADAAYSSAQSFSAALRGSVQ